MSWSGSMNFGGNMLEISDDTEEISSNYLISRDKIILYITSHIDFILFLIALLTLLKLTTITYTSLYCFLLLLQSRYVNDQGCDIGYAYLFFE